MCKTILSIDPTKITIVPGSILEGITQACNSEYYNNSLTSGQNINSDIFNEIDEKEEDETQGGEEGESKENEFNEEKFTNKNKKQHFSNKNKKQHFTNIENFELDSSKLPNIDNNNFINELNNRPIYVSRKDNKRYAIDSRPITQPIVQNEKEVRHFYPFEN